MQLSEAQLQELHDLTNGGLYDVDYGDFMVDGNIAHTRDTIDDFETNSAKWTERSGSVRGNLGPYPYIVWNKTQARAGQPRTPLTVVDMGEFRIAFKDHIQNFLE